MNLFGYYSLGLQSMSVARLGLQVAGDNIANLLTPGYVRRQLQLTTGYPVNVPGGQLDQGVDVASLRRMEDRFLQATLEREQARQSGSEELLRGLGHLETLLGPIDGGGGIAAALAAFAAAFDELSGQPDSSALRRGAVSAADALARAIGSASVRLRDQRGVEDRTVEATLARVNDLAGALARLNREIAAEEAGGGVAAPLRDQRGVVIEELVELTGGSTFAGPDGRLSFALPGGPTLVTGHEALPLSTSRAADGTLRVHSGADGSDITDRIREGRLGSLLRLRDDVLAARTADLDLLAADLITRANALTAGAFDLSGNPGGPLFQPAPPGPSGAAASIAVDPTLLQDPDRLAVSSSGAAGEGDVAALLAALPEQASGALGGRSASAFFHDLLAQLGHQAVQADVARGVSQSLVESLQARRDAISGVSLDEEAVDLIRFQRSFEAAARFLDVLNSVTEVAIDLVRR
jgi:flagellar hook-associated protein 1 FlgK